MTTKEINFRAKDKEFPKFIVVFNCGNEIKRAYAETIEEAKALRFDSDYKQAWFITISEVKLIGN